MKKKLAGLLAALLVLAMGTTVFAAVSPTAEDIAAKAESIRVSAAFDADGNEVSLSKAEMNSDDFSKALEQAGTKENLLAAVELTVTGSVSVSYPLKVTLHVPGITSADTTGTISIRHYTGSTWETITPSSVTTESVTFSLTSLSPVAVVRSSATASTGTDNDDTTTDSQQTNTLTQTNGNSTSTSNTGSSSSGGNTQTNNNYQTVNVYTTGNGTSTSAPTGASTSTTSPKTGASLPALPIIAILAVMGIAVCGKKARSLS